MLALKFQRTVCYQRLDRWGAPFLPCLSQPLKDDPALLYSASYSSKTSSFFNIWFRWYMLSIGISYPRHSFVPFWLPTRFLCIAKGQDVISLSCHDRLFGIWSIFWPTFSCRAWSFWQNRPQSLQNIWPDDGTSKAEKSESGQIPVFEFEHRRLVAINNGVCLQPEIGLTNYFLGYLVHNLPEVDADIGEMYSGLIPIDSKNTSRALFFIFQPTIGQPVDEITIWLNGGPGCSSLEGFFQENGRFVWLPGTFKPVENPYSWVNLTNMLWYWNPSLLEVFPT